MREATLIARFWSKVEKRDDGCWVWKGHCHQKGYGFFRHHRYAHRYSFELAHGPIPDGMMVLHKCDNPPCVNPDHLFLGDNTTNMRDMVAKGRGNGSKTHCRHGHALTPENTYFWLAASKYKARQCRECTRQRMRKAYHEKKKGQGCYV